MRRPGRGPGRRRPGDRGLAAADRDRHHQRVVGEASIVMLPTANPTMRREPMSSTLSS
ncbi:hypothetical protein [Kribbella catacumbae]|uniref:hypothetical protein n=1 Tax=Kribbella catacumbae TaxID=460086 RepID=UPI0012F8A356|nr:hypothetical protein [Kribbella catacumbae]